MRSEDLPTTAHEKLWYKNWTTTTFHRNSYNATIWSQKRPKHQQLQYRLKRTTEKHVFDLSGNTTSTSIEERPVSSSRSGVASECCESSFMKSSSFPAAGPFSGAVFHGGQFNITINTVNKSPTSTEHSTHSTRSDKLNFIDLSILDLPPSLFSNEQLHI